jgi:NAD dependent epimerase/dehydratase family enzyme
MGETLLLKGQRVIPSRLRAAGFKFQYVKIEQALKGLI